jgi:hypothetical protein
MDDENTAFAPFNQDKKPGFFGTDASWTGGAAIFGAQND